MAASGGGYLDGRNIKDIYVLIPYAAKDPPIIRGIHAGNIFWVQMSLKGANLSCFKLLVTMGYRRSGEYFRPLHTYA